MAASKPANVDDAAEDAQLHVNAFLDEVRRATKARLTRSPA